MSYFRLATLDAYGTPKEFWCPVYDGVVDNDGYLAMFTYKGPVSGNIFRVHSVRHTHTLQGIANAIFEHRRTINSAKGLLEDLEEHARNKNWYDSTKYRSARDHAGALGVILASAAILTQFLKDHHAFDQEGYYFGDMTCAIPYLIHTHDRTNYRLQ